MEDSGDKVYLFIQYLYHKETNCIHSMRIVDIGKASYLQRGSEKLLQGLQNKKKKK